VTGLSRQAETGASLVPTSTMQEIAGHPPSEEGLSRDHLCLEARELAICTGSGSPATVRTDFAF
jgi:hypothetical protein